MTSAMKQWRFIFSGAGDAFFNMALDEAILRSCENEEAIPTLRLYLWEPPGVSIGYFQSIENSVDFVRCRESNVDVVRRITGGRAVLHENEVTYSVCASIRECPGVGRNISETYRKISFALLESLAALGIKAEWVRPKREGTISTDSDFSKPCFISNSRYEITVAGKKLIGSAQRREGNCFIQHGSIPLGRGKVSLADLLRDENDRGRMKEKLKEKSTGLSQILKREVQAQEVISVMKRGFAKSFEVEMIEMEPTQKEIETAQALKHGKYLTEEWNHNRGYTQSRKSMVIT